MPVKKYPKKVYKKRTYRKRRTYPKARMYKRVNTRNQVHRFVRMIPRWREIDLPTDAGTFPTITSVTYLTFTLQQLQDSVEFTSLFNYYRITGVQLIYSLDNTGMYFPQTGAAARAEQPVLHINFDADNAGATSIEDMAQKTSYRKCYFNMNRRVFKLFYRPRVLYPLYRPGVTFAYGLQKGKPWIPSLYPDTSFCGVNEAFEYMNPQTESLKIRVSLRIWVQCKELK